MTEPSWGKKVTSVSGRIVVKNDPNAGRKSISSYKGDGTDWESAFEDGLYLIAKELRKAGDPRGLNALIMDLLGDPQIKEMQVGVKNSYRWSPPSGGFEFRITKTIK